MTVLLRRRYCADAAPPAERGGRAALPCLNSNNANEPTLPDHLRDRLNQLTTNHRKQAFKLAKSVARLCAKYGIERVGFLTLTFADHVTCPVEARKRFNSLRAGVLDGRYIEWIRVFERMKSGRIHFHVLVVLGGDIRTGFSFDQAAKGTYTSANELLRAEWSFWRRTARQYRFGRTELMPVKSNDEGLSKYVGKYIAKHVGNRENRDRGVRLVGYSRGANIGSVHFMFASHRSRLWRWQVSEFARRNDCADLGAVTEKFGPRWAYTHRATITDLEPPPITVEVIRGNEGEEPEIVTLSDVWHRERMAHVVAVAEATGETQAAVYMALNPRVTAQLLVAQRTEEERAEANRHSAAAYARLLALSNAREAQRLAAMDEDGERVDRTLILQSGDTKRI